MNKIRKPRLRWYQFSLRSLCLVMLLACIGMSWVGFKIQSARRQREAVEAIERSGGVVMYDYQKNSAGHLIKGAQPSHPQWLRRLLGDDFFASVVGAGLNRSIFSASQATDADLEHLKRFSQLQVLALDRTQVTDAGLEHLKGLTQLQRLSLDRTQVTDEGVKKLQQVLPKCQIMR